MSIYHSCYMEALQFFFPDTSQSYKDRKSSTGRKQALLASVCWHWHVLLSYRRETGEVLHPWGWSEVQWWVHMHFFPSPESARSRTKVTACHTHNQSRTPVRLSSLSVLCCSMTFETALIIGQELFCNLFLTLKRASSLLILCHEPICAFVYLLTRDKNTISCKGEKKKHIGVKKDVKVRYYVPPIGLKLWLNRFITYLFILNICPN